MPGHYGNVMMLAHVLRAVETATGKDILFDFDYLTSAPEWLSYAQIPEYEFTNPKGQKQSMKGLMFATDDGNPYTGFWWPQEAAASTGRFPRGDRRRAGVLVPPQLCG